MCVQWIGRARVTLGVVLVACTVCSVGVPSAEGQPAARASVQALVDLLDTPATAWAGTARLLASGPNVLSPLLSSGRVRQGPHGQTSAPMLALAKFGQSAIPPIKERLATLTRDSSLEARSEAFALIRVLGSIGPPAIVALVDIAASSVDTTRSDAALQQLVAFEPQEMVFGQAMPPWTFWRPDDNRVAEITRAIVPQVPRIAEVLDRWRQTPRTASRSSQRAAAYLVARWGSGVLRQRALDALDQLARTSPAFYEDLEAARFLHRLRAPSAAVRLHEILPKIPANYDLKDQYVLRVAIALYQLGDSSYEDVLDRVLSTATPHVLVEAIDFARTTGDPALVEPLNALLPDRTETERESITTVQGESVRTRRTIGDLALEALRGVTFQPLEADRSAWNAWRASHRQSDRRQLQTEWASSRVSRVTVVPMWEVNAWIEALTSAPDSASLPLIEAYLSRPDLDASKINSDQSRFGGGSWPIGTYGPAVVTLLLGLTQQGVPEARELLAQCLGAADPRVRMYGARALAAFDKRMATGQLARELRSSEDWIRHQAADFLVRLGDARGIPVIIEQLDSFDEATRNLACRDLRMYTQQPLPCDSHVAGDLPAVDLEYWRQWWRSHRHGFRVASREAALDQKAALVVPAVIFSRASVVTDGTVAPPGTVSRSSSITVTLRLPNGQLIMSQRAEAKPARRGVFPGTELPYDGSTASTALSVRPTSKKSIVMLLNENAGPGPSVLLTASEVGFPSDGTGIDRFARPDVPKRASEPCAAHSAFMIDGVGDRADAPVLMWFRQGQRETSFSIDARKNTLKLKPVLKLFTGGLRSAEPLEYSLRMESRVGITRGVSEPDFLVIAVGKKPDGTYISSIFAASRRQSVVGYLVQNRNESWEWRFYALEDGPEFRSHCRAK
jgi:HEAT repeat protein